MKSTESSDRPAAAEEISSAWKKRLDTAVSRVSANSGLSESTVRAGLLFAAGVVVGLVLRSRR